MAVKQQAGKKSVLLSRPVIYTFLAAVCAYAYVLNTSPAPTTSHRKTTHFSTSTATADNGILPEDLTAHFPRYKSSVKDPFVPAVELHPAVAATAPIGGGATGQWALTGINSVNGATTATIENSATNDSEFLHVGDSWNGLRVTEITPNSVAFVNALGQKSQLSFPGNDLTGTGMPGQAVAAASAGAPAAGNTTVSVPAAPRLPGLGLQPMPVPAPPASPAAAGPNGG